MTRGPGFRLPRGCAVVLTCEHASAAVPPELAGLGLPRAVLQSHRGWDKGAAPIAEALAAALAAPLWCGPWSRLVADLNRSADHRAVIAARVDGRVVPANELSPPQRAQRLQRYWTPWRTRTEAAIRRAAQRGPVLHLSVHSFTPRLHGVERRHELGLLHDPRRPREVAFCLALKPALVAAGLGVRRNFPYFGDTDGFTTHLRQRLPASRYLGIEIECNQRLVGRAAGQRQVVAALSTALAAVGVGAS